jgi:hypothetical protein
VRPGAVADRSAVVLVVEFLFVLELFVELPAAVVV